MDETFIWHSASLEAGDRYLAWSEMLQRSYGAWTMGPAAIADIDASITHRSAGTLQVTDCRSDPCSATRNRADIRRDESETVSIQLVRSGRERFDIDGETFNLGAGDVLIWSSLKPMRFEVAERLHKTTITIPLARIRSWLPNQWMRIERKIPAQTQGAMLLSSVVGSMSGALLAGGDMDGDALVESVTALLASMIGQHDRAKPSTLRGSQLAHAKAYIADHLSDPDLTPERIATARRISPRYLHLLFASEALTVQQFVIQERLLRCQRDLACPNMRHRTITDIAFSWGFQNATHFGRRFKEQFGLPPQAFRTGFVHSGDTLS